MTDKNITIELTDTQRVILLDALEQYYDSLGDELHANKVRLSYRTKESSDYLTIEDAAKSQQTLLDIIDTMWDKLDTKE